MLMRIVQYEETEDGGRMIFDILELQVSPDRSKRRKLVQFINDLLDDLGSEKISSVWFEVLS